MRRRRDGSYKVYNKVNREKEKKEREEVCFASTMCVKAGERKREKSILPYSKCVVRTGGRGRERGRERNSSAIRTQKCPSVFTFFCE